MRRLQDLWFRVRSLWARGDMERELNEEFAFHLEKEAEKYEAGGLSPDEARRRAHVKFGGAERFKEKARESWGVNPITDLAGDLRFAVRQLRKNSAFSILAALTLALGIGGTVALFSVVNGLMIRPLPMPDENRLVTFWSDYNWRGKEFGLIKTVPEHFESVAAFSNNAYTLRTDAGSTLVLATVASVELFDVLQVRPLSAEPSSGRGPRGRRASRDLELLDLGARVLFRSIHSGAAHQPKWGADYRRRSHARGLLFPDSADGAVHAARSRSCEQRLRQQRMARTHRTAR